MCSSEGERRFYKARVGGSKPSTPTILKRKIMEKDHINIPELWDKNYNEKLKKEIYIFLERFFYDGPFDVKNMMSTIMYDTKGFINPKVAQEVVEEFLEDKNQ